MKTALILTGLVTIFAVAFAWQPSIPPELLGKWKLVAGNKLVGNIEISPNGKYVYAVIPNYREDGTITLSAGSEPKQINLAVIKGNRTMTITKGIYKISGNILTLCLGNANEPRPAGFNNNGSRVIVWTGTR